MWSGYQGWEEVGCGMEEGLGMREMGPGSEGSGAWQVLEVVEHVLHLVTMVELPRAFPEAWGLSRASRLHSRAHLPSKWRGHGPWVEGHGHVGVMGRWSRLNK